MSLLLVTYDLNKPGKDYTSLYNILKSAPKWWHYLDSTWILSTSDTPDELFNKIKTALDNNDSVLIIDITNQPRQGWLPKEAWDWIRDNET